MNYLLSASNMGSDLNQYVQNIHPEYFAQYHLINNLSTIPEFSSKKIFNSQNVSKYIIDELRKTKITHDIVHNMLSNFSSFPSDIKNQLLLCRKILHIYDLLNIAISRLHKTIPIVSITSINNHETGSYIVHPYQDLWYIPMALFLTRVLISCVII